MRSWVPLVLVCALAWGCESPECESTELVRGPDGACRCVSGMVFDSAARRCVPGTDGSMTCGRDTDCDDDTYCNGAERCMPGTSGADARGCVSGAAVSCPGTQVCDEASASCVGGCDTPDADGDGHASIPCGGDDCDDADAMRFPGNTETCDGGHDEDCQPCTVGALGTSADGDGDGFVSALCINGYEGPAPICEGMQVRVGGGVVRGVDCDDGNPDVRPSQTEACNGLDDNCNDMIDEGLRVPLWPDLDGDGFGDDGATPEDGCPGTPDTATRADDCDDGDAARYTGAAELCSARDEDCDGDPYDGLECATGMSASCDRCDLTGGTQSCTSSCTWAACTGGTAIDQEAHTSSFSHSCGGAYFDTGEGRIRGWYSALGTAGGCAAAGGGLLAQATYRLPAAGMYRVEAEVYGPVTVRVLDSTTGTALGMASVAADTYDVPMLTFPVAAAPASCHFIAIEIARTGGSSAAGDSIAWSVRVVPL